MKSSKKPKSKVKPKKGGQIVVAPPQLPITQLIADAVAEGKERIELPREMKQSSKVVVDGKILLEASPGSLLPPVLEVPCLVVTGHLTLRHVALKSRSEAAVEVKGGHLELIDCHVEGAGLKVNGGKVKLLRSQIHGSSFYGLQANDAELHLQESEILDCEGDGLHCTSCKLLLENSRLAQNTLSGLVVDGKREDAEVSGCTLTENGHFGIWLDSGHSAKWRRNVLQGNLMGEVGGRGGLDGAMTSFRVGDECMVWSEDKAAWLPGTVARVEEELVVVKARRGCLEQRAEVAPKRRRSKGQEEEEKTFTIKAKLDGIRLPSGGDEPPSWTKKLKSYKRRQNAFNLFLREGGRSSSAWKALDVKERTRFQLRARKMEKDQQKETKERSQPIVHNQLVKSIANHRRQRG